jgi:lysophospholipase L1-like esterase
MTNPLLPLLIVLGFAVNLGGAEPQPGPPSKESIEWCDIWIPHANETNLPRVLLIGDSITRDYYPEVEKRLDEKAYVARLCTSRFAADPVLRQEIALVLDETKFDVIQFNNGMHGWQHSEDEYRQALPELIDAIQAHAPDAKLIWATTTPLRDGKGVIGDTKAEYSDERIAARNAVAAAIMTGEKIPIDDLNTAVSGHPELHNDNIHFNAQGIQIEAAKVTAELNKLLPP